MNKNESGNTNKTKKRRHRKSRHGDFPSLKMNQMLRFHSLIEYDYMHLLEFDPDVVSYSVHSITIKYQYWHKEKKEWVWRRYTPDFYIVKKDGTHILVECKAKRFVNSLVNQHKFSIARRYCDERHWIFDVATEADIRTGFRLKNVKHLWRYARFQDRPGLLHHVHSILTSTNPPRTVIGLATELVPDDPDSILPSLYYLVWHHQLFIPMDSKKITANSPIYLSAPK